jgi:hypothetical protein
VRDLGYILVCAGLLGASWGLLGWCMAGLGGLVSVSWRGMSGFGVSSSGCFY